MKLNLLLIICTVFALNVQARLGFTMRQCLAKYGQPVAENVFQAGPFRIEIALIDHRVAAISYSKINHTRLLDAETHRILELNSENLSWSPLTCPPAYRDQHVMNDLWRRSDGVTACYNRTSNTLLIVPVGAESCIFDDGTGSTSRL